MSDGNLPDDPELALARLEGQSIGKRMATKYVAHVREHPETVLELVEVLQDFHDKVATQFIADGVYSVAEAVEWQAGFFQSVEPIVLAFIDEHKATQVAIGLVRLGALAQQLADRQKPPASLPGLGGAPMRHPLRPEDFGAFPMPPASNGR